MATKKTESRFAPWPTQAQINRAIDCAVARQVDIGAIETGPGFVRVLSVAEASARSRKEAWFDAA